MRTLLKILAMEFDLQKICAVTISAGSILFLIAAFSPVSRVFGEPLAENKLKIITESLNQWKVTQFLFVIGAIVTGLGIGLTGILFRNHSPSIIIYVSAALLLTGAIFWSWHVYLRAVDPLSFTEGAIPAWLFIIYTFLTQAGLIIFGVALLRMGFAEWSGWLMIGSMALFFLLTIIFKDMPPLVYYIITLVTGVMMYRVDLMV
jgi:hypothetical protein